MLCVNHTYNYTCKLVCVFLGKAMSYDGNGLLVLQYGISVFPRMPTRHILSIINVLVVFKAT